MELAPECEINFTVLLSMAAMATVSLAILPKLTE